MTWPGILIWLLILASLPAPPRFAMYLLFASGTFGGLSMLPPSLIGNLAPFTVCGGVVIAKYALEDKRYRIILTQLLDVRRMGLLGIFGVYMVVTAYLYPRIFAGQLTLFSLNEATSMSFLAPSSANMTQPLYMLVSLSMALIFGTAGQSPRFRDIFLRATLFGASMLIVSGFVDLIVGNFASEEMLKPFHNAAYALLDDVDIAGQKRVVGFMPEASTFGGACISNLALLLFNSRAYEGLCPRWLVPLLCALLVYLIYNSTSSGAYVGLGIIAVIFMSRYFLSFAIGGPVTVRQLRQLFWAITCTAAIALICAFLPAGFYQHLWAVLNSVLFDKTSSSSYAERSSWTQAGINAFFTTDGIGVGVGSIRTSNWLANFAASTGVLGMLLFGGFALLVLWPGRRYPDDKSRQLALGLKLAILPSFIVSELSGTTPDPGVGLMSCLGLIYALKQTGALAVTNETKLPYSPKTQSL